MDPAGEASTLASQYTSNDRVGFDFISSCFSQAPNVRKHIRTWFVLHYLRRNLSGPRIKSLCIAAVLQSMCVDASKEHHFRIEPFDEKTYFGCIKKFLAHKTDDVRIKAANLCQLIDSAASPSEGGRAQGQLDVMLKRKAILAAAVETALFGSHAVACGATSTEMFSIAGTIYVISVFVAAIWTENATPRFSDHFNMFLVVPVLGNGEDRMSSAQSMEFFRVLRQSCKDAGMGELDVTDEELAKVINELDRDGMPRVETAALELSTFHSYILKSIIGLGYMVFVVSLGIGATFFSLKGLLLMLVAFFVKFVVYQLLKTVILWVATNHPHKLLSIANLQLLLAYGGLGEASSEEEKLVDFVANLDPESVRNLLRARDGSEELTLEGFFANLDEGTLEDWLTQLGDFRSPPQSPRRALSPLRPPTPREDPFKSAEMDRAITSEEMDRAIRVVTGERLRIATGRFTVLGMEGPKDPLTSEEMDRAFGIVTGERLHGDG